MAALQIIALMLFTVTLLREGFGVTDEEFQEILKRLETQELENTRQATVISKLEEALISSHQKCKQEVQETGLVQNTTIEERVALLEIQVVVIQDDLTEVEDDVTGLEVDLTELDENVDFLFDEQIIQDERLLELEQTSDQVVVELAETNADILDLDFRVTTLEENGGGDENSSVAELEARVEILEGTAADHETRISTAETDIEAIEIRVTGAEENIQGLQMTDVNHDARISALEKNGGSGFQNDTIAFHTALTSYDTIPAGATLIFNEVILNEGNSYDSTTGVFTVPPGGNGVYYFSTYLLIEPGEFGRVDMTLNDDVICSTLADHNTDYPAGSCSAVVDAVAGDEVKVLMDGATDTTPLVKNTAHLFNGFNGFRI